MTTTTLLLERLGALIQQSVRDDATRHGLQPIHLQILHYLSRANRYSDLPIAVSEYLGITRGTLSQSLSLLERKGLLRKRPDPRHGKRLHLTLTTAGQRILADSWSERLQQALASLHASHTGLDTALQDLLSALQKLNGQQAFGLCHRCTHFQREENGFRCGLTGEPLEQEQTLRLCREWRHQETNDAPGMK